MLTGRMLKCVVPWLVSAVVVATCVGCGGTGRRDHSLAAPSCSDSGFAEAVPARLGVLQAALLRVDAGHGDVAALSSAAPVLVAAARQASVVVKANRPCQAKLAKARVLLSKATRGLLGAGRALEPIAGSKGQVFSEDLFLSRWYAGTQDFQDALVSLRAAGVRGLVSATDGKGVFMEAGCAACHTLAAARAKGTVGPNLDDVKPSVSAAVSAVSDGSGVMISFKGALSAAQIQAVADFVSRNAGR